jgi:hypothetical protein
MILTAAEFFMKFKHTHGPDNHYKALIEFAQMHVEAALKEASENAQRKKVYNGNSQRLIVKRVIDKESILNAYPLTLIK